MKTFIKTFLKVGIPFGIFAGIFYIFLEGVYAGIFGGIFSGVFFGFFMAIYTTYKRGQINRMRPRHLLEEEIIKQDVASYPKGISANQGSLFLSDKRLFFMPAKDSKIHEIDINLSEISRIEIKTSLGIMKNRLVLFDYTNLKREFIVENPDEWVGKINELKGFELSENPFKTLK